LPNFKPRRFRASEEPRDLKKILILLASVPMLASRRLQCQRDLGGDADVLDEFRQ
jgi:hypothetical protein